MTMPPTGHAVVYASRRETTAMRTSAWRLVGALATTGLVGGAIVLAIAGGLSAPLLSPVDPVALGMAPPVAPAPGDASDARNAADEDGGGNDTADQRRDGALGGADDRAARGERRGNR